VDKGADAKVGVTWRIAYKIELIQAKSTTYEGGRHSDAKSTDPLRSA